MSREQDTTTRVPFVDLAAIHDPISAELLAAVERVIKSQRFILGSEVEEFESAFSQYLGGTHACTGTSSGSSALRIALAVLDLTAGDEVIVPAYTYMATASEVICCGGEVRFLDVDDCSLNITPESVLEALAERTRAVIPVHLFGRPVDVRSLRSALDSAGRQDVTIIEDAAQAVGARVGEEMVGSLAEMGCFSFFPAKNLGCLGDGGMVAIRDASLAARAAALRAHGRTGPYLHQYLGWNAGLDAVQAAILGVKLPLLDDWIEARRENAARYRTLTHQAELEGFLRLPVGDVDTCFHSFNQFNLRVPADHRDALRNHLYQAGVATAVYYPTPLPSQPCFESLGHRVNEFPIAETASRESLAIPIFPGLKPADQEHVVAKIRDYFDNSAAAQVPRMKAAD